MMSIQPGDKVHLLNEAGEVTFLREEGGMAVVADAHGFDWKVPIRELLPITRNDQLGAQLLRGEPEEVAPLKKRTPKPDAPTLREVDLHIHALVDSHAGMSNHEIVQCQMAHFREAVRAARAQKVTTLVLIHGVGKGVLKEEIRQALSREERCAFEDANYLQYGFGATEVRFW